MSAAMTNSPLSISGAIYPLSPSLSSFSGLSSSIVLPPKPEPFRISMGSIRGNRVAKPKSPILSDPFEEIRMLAGLISKWITPLLCMWLMPCFPRQPGRKAPAGSPTSLNSRTIFHTRPSSRRSTTRPYSSRKKAILPRHSSVWMKSCRFCSQASTNLMTWWQGRRERCRRISTSSRCLNLIQTCQPQFRNSLCIEPLTDPFHRRKLLSPF